MKIKSYYSQSVEDAMALARGEMGPDAMLVHSRRTPIQSRHLGEYEVVFASMAGGDESIEPAEAAPEEAPARAVRAPGDRLSREVAELKRELEGMRRALTRTAYGPQQWTGASQDVSEAFGALSNAEMDPELVRDIVQAASARVGPARLTGARGPQRPDGAAFQRALVEEMSSRFTADAVLGRNAKGPRIVAFAGPPGAGKTTTLVKVAVNYGLAARRPVLLLSLDTYRVAAADQLRSFAAILGVGFQVLQTVAALAQSIEENRGKELILIDTPGLSLGELEDSESLAHFLSSRDDVDTHLVLPASMKPADLTRMVNAFDILSPAHLLFTKLDETGSHGPILNESARTGKPLSFFTTGQRIPEDLEAATQQRLLDLILSGPAGTARAA